MRLTIHTFLDPTFHGDDARGASTAAYVEDGDIRMGGGAVARILVFGTDHRDASVKALQAYWRDQDTKAQAATLAEQAKSAVLAPEPIASVPERWGAPLWETTPSRIEAILHDAVDDKARVEIAYTDANENETTRVFAPSSAGTRAAIGYCEKAEEVRMFLYSRIQKARRV